MYLYGASGHGKVIAEIAEENNIKIEAFIDSDPLKTQLLGYPVLHSLPDEAAELIISIGNNKVREQLSIKYSKVKFLSLIHPKSNISKRSEIEAGTVVMAGVTINSETNIGKHCIINTNASIDHDCKIGNFVHISPNAALAGGVTIGEGTHIGIGASIIPGVKIGKWCTIGAGSVIIRDVNDFEVVVGNPSKKIKYNSSS
ncbi:MAG TPA: acetyltransferase [Edaphocola sp.]|nr:acetyltransferase [Edaphocola sp.]